jgi:hypothetical protein
MKVVNQKEGAKMATTKPPLVLRTSYEAALATAAAASATDNEVRLLAFANHIVEFDEGAFDQEPASRYLDRLCTTWLYSGLQAL